MVRQRLSIVPAAAGGWDIQLSPVGAQHHIAAGVAEAAAGAIWADLRAAAPSAAALREHAETLWELLGDIGGHVGGGVLLSIDEGFPKLPWELLHVHRERFATDQEHLAHPDLCHLAGDPALPLPPTGWPLKVLVIIGIGDDNDERARKLAAVERARIGTLLAAVRAPDNDAMSARFNDFIVYFRQDPADLIQEVNELRPHILHVVCHGRYREAAQETVLLCQTSGGNREDITAEKLIQRLNHVPRLVVLNACDAGVPLADEAAKKSVVSALLARGVGAVLAMQTEIWSTTASHFSRGFYGSLAWGSDLLTALHIGRSHTFVTGSRESFAPRLIARNESALAPLLVDDALRRLARSKVDADPAFKKLRAFVGRASARETARRSSAPVLAIVGDSRCGKTWLSQMLSQQWRLAGEEVFNVTLPRSGCDAMKLISGVAGSPFTALNARLNPPVDLFEKLREKSVGQTIPDNYDQWPRSSGPGDNPQQDAIKLFVQGLLRWAEEAPGVTLRLVFDGVEYLALSAWSTLMPLLASTARNNPWLRLVVVVNDDDENLKRLAPLQPEQVRLHDKLDPMGGWLLKHMALQMYLQFPDEMPGDDDEGMTFADQFSAIYQGSPVPIEIVEVVQRSLLSNDHYISKSDL